MKKTLSISIPTHNRSESLNSSLQGLLDRIKESKYKDQITVFVSDNGSEHSTTSVINNCKSMFEVEKIDFQSHRFDKNQGFDSNVLKCYTTCQDDYCWLLSDDDIVLEGAIDLVFDDIDRYKPNAIYCNFLQPPYTKDQPYITENKLYPCLDAENISLLQKVVLWPKLSSMILRNFRLEDKILSFTKPEHNGWMHVALFTQIAQDYGNILHSNNFLGIP